MEVESMRALISTDHQHYNYATSREIPFSGSTSRWLLHLLSPYRSKLDETNSEQTAVRITPSQAKTLSFQLCLLNLPGVSGISSENSEVNWQFKYAYIGRISIMSVANWFSQWSTISAYRISGRDKSSPHLSNTSLRWRTLLQRTEESFGHNKGTARSVLHTTYKCICRASPMINGSDMMSRDCDARDNKTVRVQGTSGAN